MEENLTNTKKWSLIARQFPGRNQHQIKNRFICVLNKELRLKREKIRSLLIENQIWPYIYEVLAGLNMKKIENGTNGIKQLEIAPIESEMN